VNRKLFANSSPSTIPRHLAFDPKCDCPNAVLFLCNSYSGLTHNGTFLNGESRRNSGSSLKNLGYVQGESTALRVLDDSVRDSYGVVGHLGWLITMLFDRVWVVL